MAGTQTGILAWASSIRASMANDPVRQLFENQINTHGFLFLDDYLENIMAGAKQDPIIELVKTPGRKKDAPRRTRAATAAAKQMKAVISEQEQNADGSKENIAPVNSFHKTLLEAKAEDSLSTPSHHVKATKPTKTRPVKPLKKQKSVTIAQERQQIIEIMSSPEPSPSVPLPEADCNDIFSPDPKTLVPPHPEQNELSVIAEDDEPIERSRSPIPAPTSTPPPNVSSVTSMALPSANSSPVRPMLRDDLVELVTAITNNNAIVDDIPQEASIRSASTSTFHSIPLDSPEVSRQSPKTTPEIHTAPLPRVSHQHSSPTQSGDAVTAPLPVVHPATHLVPIRYPDSPPRSLAHKSSVPQFPALPAPSPLRKSMRAPREPSMGMSTAVPTLPSAPALNPVAVAPAIGKRTSWLMKAREAKAMENTVATATTWPNSVTTTSAGMGARKRKSEDMVLNDATVGSEPEERKSKVSKLSKDDAGRRESLDDDRSKLKGLDPHSSEQLSQPTTHQSTILPPSAKVAEDTNLSLHDEDGIIDRLKRTVQGLGARTGRSVEKSLGGVAAISALAEARAAAIARVAERNKMEEVVSNEEINDVVTEPVAAKIFKENVTVTTSRMSNPPVADAEKRLSLSDLVPAFTSNETKKSNTTKPLTSPSPVGDESTSTTPPNSPPCMRSNNFLLPSGPVFNKPPVFVPPVQTAAKLDPAKEFSLNLPPAPTFTLPASMSLGVPARLGSPSVKHGEPLSAKPTVSSIFSDVIFDKDDDVPAWMPPSQDTVYSSSYASQSQTHRVSDLDEDDSWPLEEKIAAAKQAWGGAEDSMTWSTLPTESQRAYPEPVEDEHSLKHDKDQDAAGTFNSCADDEIAASAAADMELMLSKSELEKLGLDPARSTVSLLEPGSSVERSQSQMSMVSTSSSQSQVGFFGQATKLVNSMLGTSKKSKTEVKSLQLAAAAAKKQQEEKDKKTVRLKDMENRRQLALQRKADEEKARALQEERKIKEDGERRKREREEHTDKRPLKSAMKKGDDDTTKKRKLVVEIEKKAEPKKPLSKDRKDNVGGSRIAKPGLNASSSTMKSSKPVSKQLVPALSSSNTYNASHQPSVPSSSTKVHAAEAKTFKPTTKNGGKGKAPAQPVDDEISQPSHVLQSQMAARAKAQMQAVKQQEPTVASESIELPDINSEYSDSEDEERPRTFEPPEWAQSPELRQALQMQSTVNPDDIFGEIRPLRMEEMFRTRQSRFRARTSSANWAGADRLTVEEERDYARRMGFR